MVPLPPLRPDRYFESRSPGVPFVPALGVVLLVAVVTTAAVGAFGFVLAQDIDATRTVENPTRPPDWVCEDRTTDAPDDPFADRCSEPETITVDVGDRLWDAFADRLPLVFVAVPVTWFLVGGLLHALSWLADGEGAFAGTLTVAAWGLIPSLARTLVVLPVLLYTARDLAFTSPEAFAAQVESIRSATGPLTVGTSLAATAWEVYIYYHGMRHVRSLGREGALFVAGAAGLVTLVVGLA